MTQNQDFQKQLTSHEQALNRFEIWQGTTATTQFDKLDSLERKYQLTTQELKKTV